LERIRKWQEGKSMGKRGKVGRSKCFCTSSIVVVVISIVSGWPVLLYRNLLMDGVLLLSELYQVAY
jgi:hypothetical protein